MFEMVKSFVYFQALLCIFLQDSGGVKVIFALSFNMELNESLSLGYDGFGNSRNASRSIHA